MERGAKENSANMKMKSEERVSGSKGEAGVRAGGDDNGERLHQEVRPISRSPTGDSAALLGLLDVFNELV